MANSDFPFNKFDEESYLDFPILTEGVDTKYIHPCEVKLSKTIKMVDGVMVEDMPELGTAGSYIMVCTGVGDSITEAKNRAYEVVKKVKFGNDEHHRTDIGNRCEKGLEKIRKFGFCRDWKF
jgi:phosphoribosylamine-glycine ligase